jgi:outer membrane immunogenic protein
MNKILLSSVALLGLTAGVMAADLPSHRAPAPFVAVVPVFTWTGFYVGANAGYGWQDSDSSIDVPAGAFGAGSAGGTIVYDEDNGGGFSGGAQIGYNYQIGSFVVGLEADMQWADLGGSSDGTAVVPAGFPANFVPAGVAGGVDWFGTVRARAGMTFDRALIYATGGFAYGSADDSNDFLTDNEDMRTGWVLGAGVEYAFTNNLTAGIEGLWVNLDGDNDRTYIGTTGTGAAATPVYVAGESDENDFFVARAKLNFKFGTR